MRTFNVNVNGVLYQVEVEEIAAGAAPAAAPARPAAGPRRPIPAAPRAAAPKAAAPKPAPKAAAPAPAAAPAGKGETINAPMPGNILDVRVQNGQAVTAGQILMILEAMKMENEIIAPCAGTVSNLSVQKGSTVSSGQLLCSIG
jgi:glutaconyl-CoA decarboxylase